MSTVTLSVATECAEAVLGAPITGRSFAALAIGLSTVAAVLAWRFAKPGQAVPWSGPVRSSIVSGMVVPALLLIVLLPKFLWESFNGYGAHAFEAARLLLHQPFPFWSSDAGAISRYPGVTTALSSYPVAWFVRLFGPVEASARLPYLLFLAAGLFPGLLRLIEVGRGDRVTPVVPWLVWVGLLGFTLAMAFSATHNPYHADIALPGAQDALLMGWFLGFVVAFVESSGPGMILFGILTFSTSPAGLVLLGLWMAAATGFLRPLPRRPLFLTVILVAGCVLASRFAPLVLELLGQPGPGGEHSAKGLADRLLNIQVRDWRRALFVLLPCGILPALSLLLWHRMDRLSRAVAALAVAQFFFFYFQRKTSLHYFVPAMVLPIAVGWRLWPDRIGGRLVPAVAVVTALVAAVLSLPGNTRPHLAAREIGAGLEDRRSDYDVSGPVAFRRSELLSELFARDGGPGVPESRYGGSPLSWLYYAHRVADGEKAYLLQGIADGPPLGGRLLAAGDDGAVWVLDEAALARDEERRLPHSIARVYHLNKSSDHTR
ncbi:MAG: hypothetical protein E4H38_06945 [Gemmatimonadales bacterium]|nr:MAG: hypothetical protein E4H38_06945 [Gemmatimonadales bacterium]